MKLSIDHKVQNFNNPGKSSPDVLTLVDLIEVMAAHHQDEALSLVEQARWHEEQAAALASERRALAVAVTAALAEAEAVLA